MKYSKKICGGSVFLIIGFLVCSFCNAELKSTDKKTVLEGKLTVGYFLDANDKKEGAYILNLDTPIDVAEDKEFGGPVKDVGKVQLVIYSNFKDRELINKKVMVKGFLFYSVTAHHHTDILMDVELIYILEKTGDHKSETIKLIKIPIDFKQEQTLQMEVDKGHQPWRLDPVSVAIVAIEPTSNEIIGVQNCEKIFEKSESAKVRCRGEHDYFVKLKKMVRPDGIWTAISLDIE